jgi:hypothetical protein
MASQAGKTTIKALLMRGKKIKKIPVKSWKNHKI